MSRHNKIWNNIAFLTRKHEKRFKGKMVKRWIAAFILLLIIVYFTIRDYGFYRIGHLFWKQCQLQKEITKDTTNKDSLFQLRKKLLEDEAYVEKVAREKLGMAKKDETVYKFIDKTKKSTNSPQRRKVYQP